MGGKIMSNAVLTLKKGTGRTLKQGGPWIYDNEVESVMGSFEDGDIVLVHDFDGYPLGRGFINRNSKLIVRMMTRDRDTEVDEAFIRMRGEERLEYRKKVMDDISSCRVIFGGGGFPARDCGGQVFRCACGGIPGSGDSTGLKRRLSVS